MFWIVAIGLTLGVCALLIVALFASMQTADGDSDVHVYRDQLTEVERDLARGILDASEGERVRTEVSRRLIAADRDARLRTAMLNAPKAASLTVAGVIGAVVLGGAVWVYLNLGEPGYADQPLSARIEMADTARKNRPDQATFEAEIAQRETTPQPPVGPEFAALMERLREALKDRPDDLNGHRLLARNEAGMGNYKAAAAAQAKVVEIMANSVTAEDLTDQAEYLIMAAGGYISPEAETALTRALQIDTSNGRARYFSGLLYAQTGRPDLTFRLWRELLEAGPESAPWIPPIRAQIDGIAARAGVLYDPPAPRGPSAEDIANAQDMTPAERAEMVRGMVTGLAERLATEGGPPAEWARLIAAYGVLGETEQALAILDEAREVFADTPGALSMLEQAATRAGILQ